MWKVWEIWDVKVVKMKKSMFSLQPAGKDFRCGSKLTLSPTLAKINHLDASRSLYST